MFGGLMQPTHLILLLVIVLVFLGPKRLPEAGRSLGRGLREFKESIGGDDHEAAHEAAVLHAEPDRDRAKL